MVVAVLVAVVVSVVDAVVDGVVLAVDVALVVGLVVGVLIEHELNVPSVNDSVAALSRAANFSHSAFALMVPPTVQPI